ncbi:MAG: glycosyltransferase family 4 protein [Nitrospirota bacterium]
MRIAILWKNDYPWDVRVEKISKSLISFGHEVHIIARNLKKLPSYEKLDGIHVHRLRSLNNDSLNAAFSIPSFLNPFWYLRINKICTEHQIDLIVIRDLPLVLNGVAIAKMRGIPTLFDMAENYSALWMEVARSHGFKISNFILKNPVLGRYLERFCVKLVDHILVVIEEAKKHLVDLGVKEEKISIVSNTPDIREVEKQLSRASRQIERWNGKTVLLYQGYVNKARGLRVAVQAMPRLIKEYHNLVLVIIGDGDDLQALRNLRADLKMENHVELLGWVTSNEISALIAASDIGIIPHYASEHKNTTVPNKLFDYMVCGKPVIVSSAKPLKRIVDEEKCGLVFESGNVESFSKAVMQMISHPSAMKQFGERGREAVKKRYNWERDSRILKNVVEGPRQRHLQRHESSQAEK